MEWQGTTAQGLVPLRASQPPIATSEARQRNAAQLEQHAQVPGEFWRLSWTPCSSSSTIATDRSQFEDDEDAWSDVSPVLHVNGELKSKDDVEPNGPSRGTTGQLLGSDLRAAAQQHDRVCMLRSHFGSRHLRIRVRSSEPVRALFSGSWHAMLRVAAVPAESLGKLAVLCGAVRTCRRCRRLVSSRPHRFSR